MPIGSRLSDCSAVIDLVKMGSCQADRCLHLSFFVFGHSAAEKADKMCPSNADHQELQALLQVKAGVDASDDEARRDWNLNTKEGKYCKKSCYNGNPKWGRLCKEEKFRECEQCKSGGGKGTTR